MLRKLELRRVAFGISVRQLAKDLGISHTLLSLVLNGHRPPSKALTRTIRAWLRTPLPGDSDHGPSNVCQRFLDEKASQLAISTVQFYKEKLLPFISWCEWLPIEDIRTVNRTHVTEFLAFIRKGRRHVEGRRRPLSNGSLKLHHQTLKTFFTYVEETCAVGEAWRNPVEGIRVKASQAQTMAYSEAEISRMFDSVGTNSGELVGLRNRAILTILLNSGVRASELVAMNVSDVAEDGRVKVIGKGSKQRVTSVGSSGLEAINEYLALRDDRSGALWKTYDGRRLTTGGLRAVFTGVERMGGFTDGLYAHRFRHTAITRLLKARIPLRSVQRYAGHSTPFTTLRYAQAIDAEDALDWTAKQ